MFTIDFKRHFHPWFKYSSTLLLVACLAFAGLPQTAYASGVQSPPSAPLLVSSADTSLSIPALERVMIGEDFEFYATFDNSADTAYGPFIDLIFPANGADGAAGTKTPDGINFVSAKYESYTLPATVLTFPAPDPLIVPTPATTCVSHPFAVDASGNAVQVCGTPRDTLVVLELPFSSITPAMPGLSIAITAHVSNLADIDTPLTILERGGYRYGTDSLNNPVNDPAILNPASTDGAGWPNLQVTPRVIHIEKSFNGPKECPYTLPNEPVLNETDCYGDVNPVYESVSGPKFPREYKINIYVAAGQTVTNLDVTDYFPNNLAYLGVTSLGGGTLVDSPTVNVPPAGNNPPDNDLIVNFASLTSSTDITVDFFIPELNADGNPVLDPATGNAAVAENIASALGNWTPVDTRDPGGPDNAIANGPCPGACVPLHTLNIRSIAVQKSVAIETDNGAPGYSPGDLLKYTLDFQISDYFTFGDLVLTDVMTDGQLLDTTTAPAFTVSDWNNTTPLTGSFVTGNDLMITDPSAPTGDTTLAFNISTAMTNAGAADGILQGGEAGTTGAIIPATGQIVFYAKIQEDFAYAYPSGDASVDHGDVLFNSVTLNATLRDETTITTVLGNQTNDSVQKLKIVYGNFDKTIYAVNGSTTFSSPFTTPAAVEPGDTITFRLKQSLPSSDSDKLVLTDYLPLPIFDVTTVANFDDVTDATVPAAGWAKFGPDSTLNAALAEGVLPTLVADATANSLSFDFGSFDDPTDTTSELDILFTVSVTNAPYVDGAVLTNLALSVENTTNNGQLFHGGADRFTLKEPGISLRKGVVASDKAAAVFVPNPPGPVAFNAPGSNPSWSGVIASGDNNPGTGLINSDVENVLSGDLLTFAVVLENLGSSSQGSFDLSVKDIIPANLKVPTGGINLQARRGDGAAVTFTPVGSTATEASGLFDDGIIFDDESATQGVTHVYDPTSGQNLIVITYDLQIAAGLPGKTTIVNTATLLSYAGTEGGPNHVGVAPTNNVHSDDATITLPNTAPVITAGSSVNITMSKNSSPTPFSLTLHATDADNDPLSWSILSPAVHGAAGVDASTGVVSYTPVLNYTGSDSFVVQVSDGASTDTINVNVTIKKEPGISLRKGVVASDNAAAVFVPNPPGPVTFKTPGSNPSWSGVIASGDNNPGTNLINSDVGNVNSGNLVTFAVVLENLEANSLGAFDISVKDTIPTNLKIPAGGINLQARRGDGAAVTFKPAGSTATDPSGLFDAGIIFNDESATQGVTHIYDPANGKNLIVITYDLQIAASLAAGTTIVNTATLLSYAGTDGGPNQVGVAPTNNVYNDNATVTLPDAEPVITEGPKVNVTMSEDSSPTPFSLKLHATDANGDRLTWSILSPATYGQTGVGASTGVVSYAPFLNYNGPDSFVVQVSDGATTDTINVNVTIKSVIDKSNLIWNQNYKIQYDTWVGFEDINATAFASGYRKATSGNFTFKPNQKFTSFRWTTYRGPDQGKAKVLVDGVVKATVDLYSAATQWQYQIEIKGLTNAQHTVVIKPLNQKNRASSGKWVVVDGFKVGLTTYNDNTINVAYSDLFSYGSWLGKVQKLGPRFGAYRISSVKNASMKFSFSGTQFNWMTARGPLYGKAAIYVDGVRKKTVDLYRAGQQWQYRVKISQLTYGTHVVEIRVLHTKNPLSKGFGIVSDGFEID